MKPSERLKQLWLLQDYSTRLLSHLKKADKEIIDLSVEHARNLQAELVAFIEHLNERVADNRQEMDNG